MSDLIRKTRNQKRLSQEKMAEDLDVTANYISLIENGKKKPGMPFLKSFSDKYNIPLVLLVKEDLIPKGKSKREKELRNKFSRMISDLERSFYAY